ncbi:hypothetical protein J450_08955 [Mannheimia haemolytica D171]|nr:hypothetical protein J450_08955 [Mannheimia haemolytica D171]
MISFLFICCKLYIRMSRKQKGKAIQPPLAPLRMLANKPNAAKIIYKSAILFFFSAN